MLRTAYICSEYPAISHSFVLREVEALRRQDVDVHTFTIRRTPPERLLGPADVAEDRRTHALLPTSAGTVLRAHAHALLRRPGRYASALAEAIRLGPPGLRNRVWQVFYFAEAMLLWRELARRDVRHVHVHFANVAAWVALIAAAYDDRLTWSFTMHGPTEFDDVHHYRLAEKVRRASFVACISEFARSQLMKLVGREHWDKLRVVHCGVVAAPEASELPQPAAGPLRLLSVGRLVALKGHEVLFDALAAVRARGVDVRLTLIGDGPLRETLDARASSPELRGAVTLTGALGADAVQEHLGRADAFCLASFSEGVPVVFMEAMAAGLPVIATRIAGIPELVEDGVSGILVPPGRADAVADALVRLAGDAELRRRLGAQGNARVREAFLVPDEARRLREHLAAVAPAAA